MYNVHKDARVVPQRYFQFCFCSEARGFPIYICTSIFNTFNRKIKNTIESVCQCFTRTLYSITTRYKRECHMPSPTKNHHLTNGSQQSTFTLATVLYIRRILSMIFFFSTTGTRLLGKKENNKLL